jgi:hypothetical protein
VDRTLEFLEVPSIVNFVGALKFWMRGKRLRSISVVASI